MCWCLLRLLNIVILILKKRIISEYNFFVFEGERDTGSYTSLGVTRSVWEERTERMRQLIVYIIFHFEHERRFLDNDGNNERKLATLIVEVIEQFFV